MFGPPSRNENGTGEPSNARRSAEGKTPQRRERNRNDHRRACRCAWQTGRQQPDRDGDAADKGSKSHGERQEFPIRCDQSVTSTTRTGQVDHRRTCGHRFRVREGRLCAKAYDCVCACPACNGHVASNMATGHIDHRRVCGNSFSVKDGVVKEKGLVYRCPFSNGNVRSNVRTGRINHQPACGNLFYVTDGAVSKKTRCHAHMCPVCSTVVWSSQSCGRIAVTHDTPSGK